MILPPESPAPTYRFGDPEEFGGFRWVFSTSEMASWEELDDSPLAVIYAERRSAALARHRREQWNRLYRGR